MVEKIILCLEYITTYMGMQKRSQDSKGMIASSWNDQSKLHRADRIMSLEEKEAL